MSRYRKRSEVYLQFDGFDDEIYQHLRGENLLETKLQAIDLLAEAGVNIDDVRNPHDSKGERSLALLRVNKAVNPELVNSIGTEIEADTALSATL